MKNFVLFLILPVIALSAVSCGDKGPVTPPDNDQTLFIYMPWSTNLTDDFRQNITDFETAIKNDPLEAERILVFFMSSATEGSLFELKYEKGVSSRVTMKEYTSPEMTTAAWITSVLKDVKYYAPAKRYAMIIGAHGMGWLPVPNAGVRAMDAEKYHWEYEGALKTRFFGGLSPQYQTEVTALSKGIRDAGMKMEYIMFDDCYMSCVEVAYELKDLTDYLIACPTEIMVYGFPYDKVGRYLVGNVDYRKVAQGFYDFYSTYRYPYGTIGITKTSELDALAAVMKEINGSFTFNPALLSSVQRMDGYSPVIFFDMGDYVSKLCTDPVLLQKFQACLESAVPAATALHTDYYYSSSMGTVLINTYSGMTISDPSVSSKATAKAETAWYKATH